MKNIASEHPVIADEQTPTGNCKCAQIQKNLTHIRMCRLANNNNPNHCFSALPGKYFVQDMLKLA